MGKRKYTEARRNANRKYDAKTYSRVNLYLRVDDDAEIIDSLNEAKQNGISAREWLHNLYYSK